MGDIPGLTTVQAGILHQAARSSIVPGPVQVTSGRVVSSYVSGHLLTADATSLALIGKAVAAHASELQVEAIAGEETGGIPIVYAAAWVSAEGSRTTPFFFRKNPKPPFGLTNIPIAKAFRILLVDDVAGLGFAFERMIRAARQIGCHPVAALALIDREDGAAERLKGYGVPLLSLFRYRELTELS